MLKKQYLKNKPLCKVTFSLPIDAAPDAIEVKLLGDFNGWNPAQGIVMHRNDAAYTTVLELETGRQYAFRYLIDNSMWENDWEADEYVPTPFGVYNSIVILEEVALEKPAAKEAPAKAAAPKKAKAPAKKAKAEQDDLTKIEGIGPKIAGILADNGLSTFAELSKAKPKAIKAILEAAGNRYKMHDPATWPEQAKLAAKGDWNQLAKWQDELKGGRKA